MTEQPYEDQPHPGLGELPREKWGEEASEISSGAPDSQPIDRLVPGSSLHLFVKDYLLDRLQFSENHMSQFYRRWNGNEVRLQAYINLPQAEQAIKKANDLGQPPKLTSVVIPYSYASISTIVTYLLKVFAGRKPMFQVTASKDEAIEPASMMEIVLQYQADQSRAIAQIYQFLQDGQVYGVGVLRTSWKKEQKLRTVRRPRPRYGFDQLFLGMSTEPVKELRTVFEGSTIKAQDPFLFFPDPRVPMSQVNKSGEFVFWREFVGKHELLVEQAAGNIKWVNKIGATQPRNYGDAAGSEGDSLRHLISQGSPHPGTRLSNYRVKDFIQLDQASIEIIPAELGLGDSEVPEKWIFTLANKDVIIQAEPQDNDHGMHPVVVNEPLSLGYGFGQPGTADMMSPIQDTISWLINARIENVRATLNNQWVVDPAIIEMQDMESDEPGKLIRLKETSFGIDVRTAVQQLPVADVTGGHVQDAEMFLRFGEFISAANQNMMGLQHTGGRKTATEVRTAGESSISRLSAMAQLISAQSITDLTEQMSLNTQQYLSEGFYIQIVGMEGLLKPIFVTPEQLVGDFHFPIHDGTLPLDRVAMLDVWKEIWLEISRNPLLAQQFDLIKIFEYVAELGGARNIQQFKLMNAGQLPQMQAQVVPDEQAAQMAQSGNVVPLPQSGRTPGLEGPAQRRLL